MFPMGNIGGRAVIEQGNSFRNTVIPYESPLKGEYPTGFCQYGALQLFSRASSALKLFIKFCV